MYFNTEHIKDYKLIVKLWLQKVKILINFCKIIKFSGQGVIN